MLAAMWDSTFFAFPSGGRKYHICVVHGVLKYGLYGEELNAAPACNKDGAVLDGLTVVDAESVPAHMRCKKPGCREHWAKL